MQKRAIGLETELSVLEFPRFKKENFVLRCGMESGDLIHNIEKIMEYEQLTPSHAYCTNSYGFLFNGGRCYKDRNYLELATPECSSVEELIDYEKAMEASLIFILKKNNEMVVAAADKNSPIKNSFFEASKKSTDFQASTGSAGSHENYHIELTDECKSVMLDPSNSVRNALLLPYLLSRVFFVGSGHLDNNGFFLASPRLLLTETLFSDNPKRPLLIRKEESGDVDENHARLQIMLSDANMSSFCVKFRFGPTHIILRMIEEGFLKKPFVDLDNKQQSSLAAAEGNIFKTCLLSNKQRASFLEINQLYFAHARKFFETRFRSEEEEKIMKMWEECLDNALKNQTFFDKIVDWRIVYRFLTCVLERKYDLSWEDLRSGLNAPDFKIREQAKNILKTLQALNLRYFFLTDNRIRQILKETGFLDESLKLPEDYLNSDLRFKPPHTRAEWRFKVLKYFSNPQLASKYRLTVNWGIINTSERYSFGKPVHLKKLDPLDTVFISPF